MNQEKTNHSDNLIVLQTMSEALEDYIVDGEVYHTLLVPEGNGTRTIKMSGGDLLARMADLQEAKGELSTADQATLSATTEAINSTIRSLRTRFHEVLERELKSRRDISKWAAEERSSEDGDNRITPAEVDNRQRIDAIRKALAA